MRLVSLQGPIAAAAVAVSLLPLLGGGPALVRITEPSSDQILYGKTRVVAEVSPGAEIRSVLFHLDPFPQPICRATAAPYVCEFDAGVDFLERTIRVVARGADGEAIGGDRVETLAFPRPLRVVRYVLTLPVVATSEGDEPPDLTRMELSCWYAGKPCDVDEIRLLELTRVTPLSVELLVDVSPSVVPDRDEVRRALESMIDAFPDHAFMRITEFAGHYRRLGEFTRDREELREQIRKLGINVPWTCLYRALEHSLFALKQQPGHRALFILSDGIDTCEQRFGSPLRQMGPLYHVIGVSRSVNAPIYIYRMQTPPTGGIGAYRPYEGLARETGGRLFTTGDLYGLLPAFRDVVEDVKSTWRVSVTLPRGMSPGTARRLELGVTEDSDVKLRYPEYWEAGNREATWMALLWSDVGEARLDAAERLKGSDNPEVLRALLDVIPSEPERVIRDVELEAALELSALLLVHGEAGERKAALNAIEQLQELAPEILPRLRPALDVFQKLDVPDRLKRRAREY